MRRRAALKAVACIGCASFASASTSVAIFNAGPVQGRIIFTDAAAGSVETSATLCYADGSAATTGHKWHIHEFGAPTTPIDATNCLSAGGHWDPTDKEHPLPGPYVCTPEARAECYTGDLSGMLGPLAVSPDNSFSPLTNFPAMGHGDVGSAADLRTHSIVIHAADGGANRLACADITSEPARAYNNPCEGGSPPPPPPRDPPPPPPGPAAGSTPPPPPAGGGGGQSSACPAGSNPCIPDCKSCQAVAEQFTTATIGDGTFPVDVFAGLTVKPEDHACITSLADSGVLQSMLKMLSCCIDDANAASQCAVTPDDPGCSSQASTKFPTTDRVHKCQEMFDLAELHTCGQAAVSLTDPSALKDATSHGVRCIATAQWEDNDVERSMQLAAPCDPASKKLCFQGCTFPQMDDILSSGALRRLVDQCSREMNFPAPSVSFVKTSCVPPLAEAQTTTSGAEDAGVLREAKAAADTSACPAPGSGWSTCPLDSWTAGTEPCGDGYDDIGRGFVGVKCDARGGRVVYVRLSNIGVGGELLPFFGRLGALLYLRSGDNPALRGDVADLAGATELRRLELTACPLVVGEAAALAALVHLGEGFTVPGVTCNGGSPVCPGGLFLAGSGVHGPVCTSGSSGAPKPPPPPAQIQSCSSMAEFQAVLDPINTECCDEPDEDCSSGYPARCNGDCAAVLLPVQAACADFLRGPGLKPLKQAIDTAASKCPLPLPPCSSYSEFTSALSAVTDACCDEPTEDCSNEYPASCNADCAKVLLPVQEACTEFLHGPGMKPVLNSINAAAANCQSGH